jgi:hypothetical protein
MPNTTHSAPVHRYFKAPHGDHFLSKPLLRWALLPNLHLKHFTLAVLGTMNRTPTQARGTKMENTLNGYVF